MIENTPLVSVIIPCYNDWQYVEQAVDSVLNQTYNKIEVIVVDDGSDLRTKKVLKKLEPKITRLLTQENKGQSTARNNGIKEGKGEYILVLDSDDFFEPSFCEKSVKLFAKDNTIKLITSYSNLLYDDKEKDIFKPRGGKLDGFLLNNLSMGSAIFKKQDCIAINGYDESMRKGFEDWEFYIRLLKNGGVAAVIQEPLFNYRKRIDSTTSIANSVKFELLTYIYNKHEDLYKGHFKSFVSHLLFKIEQEELGKITNEKRIEFQIGKFILNPFRRFKAIFK